MSQSNTAIGFEWSERLPLLAGKRIEMRRLEFGDINEVFEIFGDPQVIRYWGMPILKDLEEAKGFIEQTHKNFSERKLFGWGVSWNETGRIIGTGTLLNVDQTHRRAEIGFAVMHSYWGNGIATEIVETLLGFAFGKLGLHRMEADVDPRNAASLRVLERQGFQREGFQRERWHLGGEIQDSVIFGLLKREWTLADK